MKKFVVIYHAPTSAMEQMSPAGSETAKESMGKWMEWAKNCGPALLDLGSPLGNGQKVTTSGNTPSDKNVVGYSILQAKDMEAAKKLLNDHPHLWTNTCEIEIHECLPLPS